MAHAAASGNSTLDALGEPKKECELFGEFGMYI